MECIGADTSGGTCTNRKRRNFYTRGRGAGRLSWDNYILSSYSYVLGRVLKGLYSDQTCSQLLSSGLSTSARSPLLYLSYPSYFCMRLRTGAITLNSMDLTGGFFVTSNSATRSATFCLHTYIHTYGGRIQWTLTPHPQPSHPPAPTGK